MLALILGLLLAAEAGRRLAVDGKKVLLLCFTAPLRKWLAARLEGTGIEVQTISGLARRMENLAGRAPPPGTVPEAEGWAHAFRTAAEVCEPRWDAVVVDEGQDLQSEAWAFVADAVGLEIDRLLKAGLKLADIGVVSLRGKAAGGSEAGPPTFGQHSSVRADADDAEERLVADTFLRWKGLERPANIVTELPEEELSNLKVRLNVALTRATVAVRVVGSAAALGRFGLPA